MMIPGRKHDRQPIKESDLLVSSPPDRHRISRSFWHISPARSSMCTSKFTESQIVATLKQADAGLLVKDICRQAGISTATYYQLKSKYGGLEASELRRVKELESENAKLKRMYAELALDNAAMKDLIAKNSRASA